MWQIMLVIGLVFSPLAAATAFLITYEEWSRHQIPRREAIKHATHMAAVALAFFLLLAVALGLFLS